MLSNLYRLEFFTVVNGLRRRLGVSMQFTLIACLSMTSVGSVASAATGGDLAPELQKQYQLSVSELGANQKVKVALEFLDRHHGTAIDELVKITEIEAPPFDEAKRAEYFAKRLRALGLDDVTIDELGNVIGRRPGKSRHAQTIAYSAHLDTVFPAGTNVSVKIEAATKDRAARYIAPGIGDNSRGLVTVLEVLAALQKSEIETESNLLFIANVGEEGLGDLRGIKHLFRDDAEKIDFLVAVDGSNPSRVVYGGVGSHRYRVIFKGPGGHSWGAFGYANPHHALGRAISLFLPEAKEITSEGAKTSYNVGRIGGGTSINSIPFESWMEVDLRSVEQAKLDDIDLALQDAVVLALRQENEARLSGPEIAVEMKRVGTRPAGLGDPQGKLVQSAMAAIEYFNLNPNLRISSTDANIPISKNIPAITMSGGGTSGRAHSLDEWWQDDNAVVGPKIGLLTLLSIAGIAE